LEKPKGNLNNDGDMVILRDAKSNIIDQLVYGNWNDGLVGDNAPAASDPDSLARVINGGNTFNNAYDFKITTTPTKSGQNIITADPEESEVSAEERSAYSYNSKILITEVFPNPPGDDSHDEFIELYNADKQSINLRGWMLKDESAKNYVLKECKKNTRSLLAVNVLSSTTAMAGNSCFLDPGQYLVIHRSVSKIALNNTSDTVKLFQPLEDESSLNIGYSGNKEGWSYSKKSLDNSIRSDYFWSETVTPGKQNIIQAKNHFPTVDFSWSDTIVVGQPIIFDSSDTYDEDGDVLDFFWDFGDGSKNSLVAPEHTYFAPGNYEVKLAVSDGQGTTSREKIIALQSTVVLGVSNTADEKIIINEFMPNPDGNDEEEYVELFNPNDWRVSLHDWSLDDSAGGSQPYKFSENVWMQPLEYLVVDKNESHLALNNTFDSVRLFNPLNVIMNQVSYEKVVAGKAYQRTKDNFWVWSDGTPGEENIIIASVSANARAARAQTKKVSNPRSVVATTLEKIKDFEAGDLVSVKGIVAVLPGILGSQFFYIVGSPGLQIYNYKKDFPVLREGDYIEVSGELSVVNGEMRLKTKTKDNFKIIENRSLPVPEIISGDKLGDEQTGMLVEIAGEITTKNGSLITVDDGSDEIPVYIKAASGIKTARLKVGDNITVSGIVGKTKNGIRVMPRSELDIINQDQSEEIKVLGETLSTDEWTLEKKSGSNKNYLFFFLFILFGISAVGLFQYFKRLHG
jgi:PKD repeat protein/DNA/RNA endonuclease YhcR with UshA esterase domain